MSGMAFLILTVTLGFSFALALTVPALAPYLTPRRAGASEHGRAGLGGWVSLTAMGVSYTLLPMCMLVAKKRGIVGTGAHILGTVGRFDTGGCSSRAACRARAGPCTTPLRRSAAVDAQVLECEGLGVQVA